MNLLGRHSIPVTWDYSEAAILENTVGGGGAFALLPTVHGVRTEEPGGGSAPQQYSDCVMARAGASRRGSRFGRTGNPEGIADITARLERPAHRHVGLSLQL